MNASLQVASVPTTPTQSATKERLIHVLAHGVTIERVRRESGQNRDDFELWLFDRKDWRGPERVALAEKKVSAWLDEYDELERLSTRAPEWVEAPSSIELLRQLQFARDRRQFRLVEAASGMSKTKTSERFRVLARLTEGVGAPVFFITITENTISASSVLGLVAEECGVGLADKTKTDMMERHLRQELDRVSRHRPILLVDEAQHLLTGSVEGMKAVNSLRAFNDKQGLAIVLLSSGEVYSRIFGKKSAVQLLSRMERAPALLSPTEGDVSSFMSAWGVKQGDLEKIVCTRVAGKDGTLRRLTKVLGMADEEARSDGEELSAYYIDAADRRRDE